MAFDLTFNVSLKNLMSSAELPIKMRIKPKESVDLTKISPTDKDNSYTITNNIKSVTTEDEYFIKEPNVTIYTKTIMGLLQRCDYSFKKTKFHIMSTI